ncbi:hypothetical protein IEO70_01815 [Bacillus sp. AGMB 02131]|uniref:Uncharacterized protein n=1 Tax=Peribacillus faecalis TaxID=2772559 RepID=A0A927CTV3_9BACI|nr:hypothetical protein [Peribacillus faecalis]MBD3107104.1 hypothetical protein [Peribacillus faecalis]
MKNSLGIIIGFTILGLFLMVISREVTDKVGVSSEYRYDLVPANENNIIIFDKQSGEYWTKFIPSDEGPTTWEKGDSPIRSSDK